MIHIYTGNGKGKTTAAAGLAVRASGAGLKVCFVQFLKNGTSSEIVQLRKLGITVMCAESCCKFTRSMNPEELACLVAEHDRMLNDAGELVRSEKADMLVLDEFMASYNGKLFDTETALELICSASAAGCEVVLTGRNAPENLLALADYVTVLEPRKHPFTRDIKARKGIEY